MFLEKNFEIDNELNILAEDLLCEEELFEFVDSENKDSRLNIRQIDYIMRKIHEIKFKKNAFRIFDVSEGEQGKVIVSINKSEMIKKAMDFLKSIDVSLHVDALKLFTGFSNNQELKIYNYHDVKDFSEKDDNGFCLFEKRSMRMTDKGRSKIYIVLFDELNKSTSENITVLLNSSDICSYRDLFKLIHELAHGFDKKVPEGVIEFKNDSGIFSKKESDIPKTAEALLSETTAIFFEHLLGDYLIKENPSNRGIVNQIIQDRINSNRICITNAGIKSALIVNKLDNEFITTEVFSEIAEFYEVDEDEAREELREDSFLYSDKKYALAELLVPTMLKKYRENPENGNKRLIEYLNAVKENDFKKALKCFDISFSKNGLKELLDNLKEYEKYYLTDIDFNDIEER